MKLKKEARLIITIIFWGGIYLLARSQRFELDKNPYIAGIVFLVFIAHILYEGVYKKNKIESRKKEVKGKHLDELKSNLNKLTPEIKTGELPTDFEEFIPIIKKWGIENKILREDLYENSSNNELLELKSIESKRDFFEKWISENQENENVVKALSLTLKSYDDLGLWTWNQNKNSR